MSLKRQMEVQWLYSVINKHFQVSEIQLSVVRTYIAPNVSKRVQTVRDITSDFAVPIRPTEPSQVKKMGLSVFSANPPKDISLCDSCPSGTKVTLLYTLYINTEGCCMFSVS